MCQSALVFVGTGEGKPLFPPSVRGRELRRVACELFHPGQCCEIGCKLEAGLLSVEAQLPDGTTEALLLSYTVASQQTLSTQNHVG
jgi:hypothetical protein